MTKLKMVLWEKKITQRELSHRSGINEATVSMIANGRYLPDANQRLLISTLLDEEPENLFEPFQMGADRPRLRRRKVQ